MDARTFRWKLLLLISLYVIASTVFVYVSPTQVDHRSNYKD